jgi:hypothetical protein
VLIDPEGIYDPRVINDRLVLGLRGTMSEFELGILRQRSVETIRQKAKRGELRFCLPVGLCWGTGTAGSIELHPDGRVQNAIYLVLRKFQQLASARQVLLWCREQQITLPALGYSEGATHCDRLPMPLPLTADREAELKRAIVELLCNVALEDTEVSRGAECDQ